MGQITDHMGHKLQHVTHSHLWTCCLLYFLIPSQKIGWEEHLQNDLFCVDWDSKPSLSNWGRSFTISPCFQNGDWFLLASNFDYKTPIMFAQRAYPDRLRSAINHVDGSSPITIRFVVWLTWIYCQCRPATRQLTKRPAVARFTSTITPRPPQLSFLAVHEMSQPATTAFASPPSSVCRMCWLQIVKGLLILLILSQTCTADICTMAIDTIIKS